MRDSIGGTWIMGIFIIFIALFASFMAYSISYTRAFRVKNEIINMIERNEGYTSSRYNLDNVLDSELANDPSVEGKAFYFIKSLGYNYTSAEQVSCDTANLDAGVMKKGGYCLKKLCPNNTNDSDKIYYKVTTFIALSIPMFDLTVRLPISGETKAMYYDVSDINCYN